MSALVSVIIPNHNYANFLATTIESVLSQSIRNLELIVVDNGSTDNSREIIKTYRGDLKAIFQNNLGQAGARNTGILEAKGDFIALLDADDYWEPRKLEMQLEMISDEYQFIYSGLRQFDSDSGATINSISPIFFGDCKFNYLKFPTTAIVPAGESSCLFSKQLVKKVGKFNEKLNSATGRDFFRRCSNFTKFHFVDSDLVNYRIHNRNMSKNLLKIMQDTELAYDLLFSDPDWRFASKYRRSTLTKLHWSHTKTCMKMRYPFGVIENLLKMVNP